MFVKDRKPFIMILSGDVSEKDAIFNYRRKYLPTQQVVYHTPPRFPIDVINSIREGASLLFQRLGLHDFARIDGWFLPSSTNILSSSEGKYGRIESVMLIEPIRLVEWNRPASYFSKLQSVSGHLTGRSNASRLTEALNKSEGAKFLSHLEGTLRSGKYPLRAEQMYGSICKLLMMYNRV
ncbi:hypothetical protein QYF36_007246 [Acer negundo]|nr:hypothetical protein QYF36_007246 [Acer negundo]